MTSYASYLEEFRSQQFSIAGDTYSPTQIISLLQTFLTPQRLQRIQTVATGRTNQFIPILADIYDRGNISAVLRSAEGLGFQEVHLIQRSERFKVANRVTRGADEWVDIFPWSDLQGIAELKKRGYQIFATGFENARPLYEVDFSRPVSLVFGNEKRGVNPDILEQCDGTVFIPMHGFSQSFNISVAAAISMYQAREFYRRESVVLSDEKLREFYLAKLILCSLTNPENLLQGLKERRVLRPAVLGDIHV